jgi:hypothetical protein
MPAGSALVSNAYGSGGLHFIARYELAQGVQFRGDEHIAVCKSATHSDWYHSHTTRQPSRPDRPHHLTETIAARASHAQP